MQRDFRGYAGKYPNVRWPNGAGLAVSLVLNVEEGAELTLSAGDEKNESGHEVVQEVRGAPDLCMESHFEYGSRVGYWRIIDTIERHRVPLTINACARALVETPWVGQHAAERGYQIQCHGWRWEAHAGMAEADERALIARSVDAIRQTHGKAPVGWHTKSSPSVNTRKLLVEHGGFLYDSDAYNDDAPYYVDVNGKPHLVLPYSFDTNDMRFFAVYAFVRASDFADYCIDAFECLKRESVHAPRVLSIGLHTRIIGRPARIAGLATLLAHIQSSGGAWFATREEIARHWLAAAPPD